MKALWSCEYSWIMWYVKSFGDPFFPGGGIGAATALSGLNSLLKKLPSAFFSPGLCHPLFYSEPHSSRLQANRVAAASPCSVPPLHRSAPPPGRPAGAAAVPLLGIFDLSPIRPICNLVSPVLLRVPKRLRVYTSTFALKLFKL